MTLRCCVDTQVCMYGLGTGCGRSLHGSEGSKKVSRGSGGSKTVSRGSGGSKTVSVRSIRGLKLTGSELKFTCINKRGHCLEITVTIRFVLGVFG